MPKFPLKTPYRLRTRSSASLRTNSSSRAPKPRSAAAAAADAASGLRHGAARGSTERAGERARAAPPRRVLESTLLQSPPPGKGAEAAVEMPASPPPLAMSAGPVSAGEPL